MAVVNSPWVGNARGKLGEGVYYRSKGNTVARAYNPEPTNRRTVSQQQQRSLFSSAVKFFARGVQNLFVFAFENKKPQESDYNAFMRYNAKVGMYFGPEQNDDDTYPALGNFVMTRGSLGTFRTNLDANGPEITFEATITPGQTVNTLAEVSQILVDSGLSNGDIITFLGITTEAGSGDAAAPVIPGETVPNWVIRQFTVDLANTDTMTSLGFGVSAVPGSGIVITMDGSGDYESYIAAGAVVVSRLDGGQLRVSNSDLMLNEIGQLALELGRSVTWRNVVMAAWSAEQLSILQGGVSVNSVTPDSGLRVAYQFATPISNGSLNGLGLITSEALSTSRFADLIRMATATGSATFEVEGSGVVGALLNNSSVGAWSLDESNPRRWLWYGASGTESVQWTAINLSES